MPPRPTAAATMRLRAASQAVTPNCKVASRKRCGPELPLWPGYSPLLAAAANGHLEVVKLLLAHGADLHAKANDGKNALAIAEERKHAAVADHLRAGSGSIAS